MLSAFQTQLAQHGFHIVHAFPLAEIHIEGPHYQRLASLMGDARTGLLVGNTRALWPHFLQWLAEDPDWTTRDNPIDDFAMETITQAAKQHLPGAQCFWTHELRDYLVPVQKLCHHTGLAFLSKGHFNIHPTYGPWFGMRALVVFPEDIQPPLRPAVNPNSEDMETRIAEHFAQLVARASEGLDGRHIRTSWRDWLGLRDLYRFGREHRYSDAQVRYHYTKDKTVLQAELRARGED